MPHTTTSVWISTYTYDLQRNYVRYVKQKLLLWQPILFFVSFFFSSTNTKHKILAAISYRFAIFHIQIQIYCCFLRLSLSISFFHLPTIANSKHIRQPPLCEIIGCSVCVLCVCVWLVVVISLFAWNITEQYHLCSLPTTTNKNNKKLNWNRNKKWKLTSREKKR